MRYVQILFVMVLMGFAEPISAQELEEHRWKERLVLIYTEDREGSLYKEQIDVLKTDLEGLNDRKLVIYHFMPDSVKKGLGEGIWEKRSNSLDEVFQAERNFEVLLLGLDGRVKLRQDHLLTLEKLFSIIDAMPMRQSELRNRNK